MEENKMQMNKNKMQMDKKVRKPYQKPQLMKVEMDRKPSVLAGAPIPAIFSNCGNC